MVATEIPYVQPRRIVLRKLSYIWSAICVHVVERFQIPRVPPEDDAIRIGGGEDDQAVIHDECDWQPDDESDHLGSDFEGHVDDD
ncbi:hypothetical protein AC579_8795 [Pseudocercospora musae]|uniref:Uncharacterized protein n=1 Tax=Pseudocercospora musae TaxID=113226 RepID=A0A139HQB7_9PEZI|nr:hypothetical protein AC579_8795 [Pseudocercospora musae]